jgi:hypothetical protein
MFQLDPPLLQEDEDQLVRQKGNQLLGEEGLQMLLEGLEESPRLPAVEGKGRTRNRGLLLTDSRTSC